MKLHQLREAVRMALDAEVQLQNLMRLLDGAGDEVNGEKVQRIAEALRPIRRGLAIRRDIVEDATERARRLG